MSKDVDIKLGRSNRLLVTIVLVFLMALFAVIILQASWALKLLLLLALIASLIYTLKQVLFLGQDAIVALRSKQTERVWLVKLASGVHLRLEHFNARLFKSLVILQLINPVNQRHYRCFIVADAVTELEHSQLRALVLSLQGSGDN